MARYNIKNLPDDMVPEVEKLLDDRNMDKLFNIFIDYRLSDHAIGCCPSGKTLNFMDIFIHEKKKKSGINT